VTALIGPNGGGKTTILNAAACAYFPAFPEKLFPKSKIGDETMDNWTVEYEVLDRGFNPRLYPHGTARVSLRYGGNVWTQEVKAFRVVRFFSISRTVPVSESPQFQYRSQIRSQPDEKKAAAKGLTITSVPVNGIEHIKTEAEKILGKSLAHFELLEVTFSRTKQLPERTVTGTQSIFVGSSGDTRYSEFNFGAGESSILRIVSEIENMPEQSLVLIEELENGLHPLAVRRLTEYLIHASKRKKIQVIFTTHSDYALSPLPPEGIWACLDGHVQQGKLQVEVLRAVSGRVDRKLAIFVEDGFAKAWVEAILRAKAWVIVWMKSACMPFQETVAR
jgi:hypothetical protein